MSTEVQENVFASPWKKSDVVLIVEDTEFHVHRSFLTIQSAVFDAMLNGNFKDASQEKITLEGKTPEDMMQFLRFFYPENMIKKPVISFHSDNDDGVVQMLVLADEYQAEDVMNECLKKTSVTEKNVFLILPYAVKYNQSVRGKCIDVIKCMSMKELEVNFVGLDQKLIIELLTAKCRRYESIISSNNRLSSYFKSTVNV